MNICLENNAIVYAESREGLNGIACRLHPLGRNDSNENI